MVASSKATAAPSSMDEGLNGIVSAIAIALTAPDSGGPQGQALLQMMQMALGIKKMGQGGAQQKAPGAAMQPGGAPPGAMGGGGTNIRQLMGGAPSGPSAGMAGGPTSTGISPEDAREAAAQAAG